MSKAPIDIRSLARSHTKKAIEVLGGILANGKRDADRIAAANALLDRGWGKAAQAITGADGEGPVVINIKKYAGD